MTETLDFEASFQELEQVVQQLERGTTSLEESLRLYERGTFLAAYCEQLLEAASLRVRQLHDNDLGTIEEREFGL